jgi:hypothetical protein
MEMAKARMIENNAFIVLNYSFLTARMRLPASRREFEVEKISAARGDPEIFRGWARQDSNLGPRDYESPALTAELQARLSLPKLDRRCVPNSAVIRRNCRVGGDLGEGHQAIAAANLRQVTRSELSLLSWAEVGSFAVRQQKTRIAIGFCLIRRSSANPLALFINQTKFPDHTS